MPYTRQKSLTSPGMPLKVILMAPFVMVTLLAIMLVSYSSFLSGRKAVTGVAQQLQHEISGRIQSHVSNLLDTPVRINKLNANALQDGLLDATNADELEHHFWRQLHTFPFVSSIYFGNLSGGLVNSGREGADGSQYVIVTDEFKRGPFRKYRTDDDGSRKELLVTVPDFDARKRSWYTKAVKHGTAVWSPIYILFTGQDMAVAASHPAYDRYGALLGVVSVDLFLSHISTFLRELVIGERGRAFIIEPSGLLVASSENERLFTTKSESASQRRLNGRESGSVIIRDASDAIKDHLIKLDKQSNPLNLTFESEGNRCYLQASPIPGEHMPDWYVVVIVSEADFLGQIKANRQVTWLLGGITLALTMLIGFYTSKRVGNSINRLRFAVADFAQGERDVQLEDKSGIAELSMLTQSFNTMRSKLQHLLDNLNHEILERKTIEEQIRKEQEFIELALNAQLDTFFFFDPESGKALRWNRAFNEISGYTDEEIANLPAPVSYYSEADLTRAADFIQHILEKGSGTIELELICKDGSTVPFEYRVALVHDADGKPKYLISIGRDITERKKAEAKQLQLQEQLHQSHKMEAIGTIAGGIAHDFNNILGIILGNAELALAALKRGDRVEERIEEIHDASLRASDVVRQLLNFSRKIGPQQQTVDLRELVEKSVRLLRASIPTSIEFKVELTENTTTITADPTQIHQVLINLCTNASHAMSENGGVLSISLTEVEVDAEQAAKLMDINPGRYAELRIADTGQGIDPLIQDKIFDPYFTTKEVGDGTGMGLAVVLGVVKNHSGAVTVSSKPGKGSTFTVLFPMVEDEHREYDEEDTPTDQIHHGKGVILFIDDEEQLVRLGQRFLEQLGYTVEIHTNPIKAMECFRERPATFDLIITDMTMPQMSGSQLLEEAIRIRKDIPVIICTGFSGKIDEQRALEAGAICYLEKPFSKQTLSEAVYDALNA